MILVECGMGVEGEVGSGLREVGGGGRGGVEGVWTRIQAGKQTGGLAKALTHAHTRTGLGSS